MGAGDLLAFGFLPPMALAFFKLNAGVQLDRLLFAVAAVLAFFLGVSKESLGQDLWIDLLLDHDLGDMTHRVTTQRIPGQVDHLDPVLGYIQQDVATYQQVLERLMHRRPTIGCV